MSSLVSQQCKPCPIISASVLPKYCLFSSSHTQDSGSNKSNPSKQFLIHYIDRGRLFMLLGRPAKDSPNHRNYLSSISLFPGKSYIWTDTYIYIYIVKPQSIPVFVQFLCRSFKHDAMHCSRFRLRQPEVGVEWKPLGAI